MEKPWRAIVGAVSRTFEELNEAFIWALSEQKPEPVPTFVEGMGKRWQYREMGYDVKWVLT